jgi:hypothetical protein
MASLLRRTASAALGLAAAGALARDARAQVGVTIDWQGPTIAKPDPVTSAPLTEADVLIPAAGIPGLGPLPPPRILLSGQALGLNLYTSCAGHPPGTPCGIEVDSLSHGFDALLTPAGTGRPGGPPLPRIWFSVDEYAKGTGAGLVTHPQVRTEALFGEAASDLFVDTGLPGGPLPPGAVEPDNVAVVDGDGLPSPLGFHYPGIGLVEPNPPSTTLPNPGDNVDGIDRGFPQSFPLGGVFFSLDSAFSDPLSGLPSSGSALQEGVSGADVLRTPAPGVSKVVYAPALLLGLDLFGPGTDDLDALALRENGDFHYQPSQVPYDWLGPGDGSPTDMLIFSVRRGSAVIGRPDSIFGRPIEEGDLLVPPVAGGLSPFPGIFIAAENLGLATVRSGTAALFGDDVDALDVDGLTEYDCNGNGVEDSVDIATGASSDTNLNGIPDECEGDIATVCRCPALSAVCDNPDPTAGCANSTGSGGLLAASGTTSLSAGNLVLSASSLPLSKLGMVYMGTGAAFAPFADGLRCIGGQTYRFSAQSSGSTGSFSLGPGIPALSCSSFPTAGCITSGSTWRFQAWHRDPDGPCGSGSNLTNGLVVTFVP